jgi:PST family polysaccharide transporter
VSLASEAGKGLAWTGAAKSLAQIVGVGVTLVLARVLTPDDFGLIAMVAVVTGFLTVLGDFGFSAALIQRKDLEERHRSSVFWLSLCVGVALAAGLALLAPLLSQLYRDPRLTGLVRVLAIGFVIAPLGAVHSALLSRALRFRALALAETVGALVSSGVALALALSGYGVWALAGQLLAQNTGFAVAAALLSGWRPHFSFERRAIADLGRFSANLFGHTLVAYWTGKVDDFLIGRTFGAQPLGLYSRAYSTMMMPVTEIGSVLSRVMFPTFSRSETDPKALAQMYLKIVATIGFVTFPVMFALAVLSRPFILVLFGPQWVGAADVLSIYSFTAASQAIATTTTWLYTSQGRTDLLFRWTLAAGALLMTSIYVGVRLGSIEAVAACYAATSVLLLSYPRIALAGRLIGISFGDVFRAIRGVLACALIAAAGIWALGLVTATRLSSATDFVLRASVAVVVYLVLVRVTGAHGYVVFRTTLRGMLGLANATAKPDEASDQDAAAR